MLMQLFKKIRDLHGWSKYRQAKKLRISQTSLQHYEDTPVSNREMLLVQLQEISGLSVQDFWEMLVKEVKPAMKAKRQSESDL